MIYLKNIMFRTHNKSTKNILFLHYRHSQSVKKRKFKKRKRLESDRAIEVN